MGPPLRQAAGCAPVGAGPGRARIPDRNAAGTPRATGGPGPGDAPPVLMARVSSPRRTWAGTMKVQYSGSSATLTQMARAWAAALTAALTSGSSVAAMTRAMPSTWASAKVFREIPDLPPVGQGRQLRGQGPADHGHPGPGGHEVGHLAFPHGAAAHHQAGLIFNDGEDRIGFHGARCRRGSEGRRDRRHSGYLSAWLNLPSLPAVCKGNARGQISPPGLWH